MALVFLSLLGLGMGLYMNRLGVDVEPDSAVYATSGILFAHGQGISMPNQLGAPQPMVWFPPLTPWVVSLCEWSGLDIRKSFGAINAVSWALLIGSVGVLARKCAKGRWVPGILAAGVITTSYAICTVNGFLYSEPMFQLFSLGTLAMLASWWECMDIRRAAVAGLFVGLALLTRYVGVTLFALGGLVILMRLGMRWRPLFNVLTAFSVPAAGPMFAWHLWQKFVKFAPSSERTLAWHPITAAQVGEGIETIASFVVPPALVNSFRATRIIAMLTMGLLVVVVWLWLGRKGGTAPEKPSTIPALAGIGATFIVIYLGFLVLSISIADADTPLDWRILSITIPPGAIIGGYLLFVAGWKRGNWRTQWATIVICGALLAIHGYYTFSCQVCRESISLGPDETSEALNALRLVPDHSIIFSNAPCEVYMAARMKTEQLPLLPEGNNSQPLEDKAFKAQIERMRRTLAPGGGWVLYWNGLNGDPPIPRKMLQSVLPIAQVQVFGDGALLRISPAPR